MQRPVSHKRGQKLFRQMIAVLNQKFYGSVGGKARK